MKYSIARTSDLNSVQPFIDAYKQPEKYSHKGQNGKLLIIGGSSLFHSASLWAAETASHIVDMVHYCSTEENNEIITAYKKMFQNGIVVKQEQLVEYAKEDDVILIGPGMMRSDFRPTITKNPSFKEILTYQNRDEGLFTYFLMKHLLLEYPHKKYVIDAGALQMMEKNWLSGLKTPPILTPHLREFEKLFGVRLSTSSVNWDKNVSVVKSTAKTFRCILVVKAVDDIISDGKEAVIVTGGNAGLTKGGTGDILAGIIASLYSRSSAFVSAVISSYLLKSSADRLYDKMGTWYNNDDIVRVFPQIFNELLTSGISQ